MNLLVVPEAGILIYLILLILRRKTISLLTTVVISAMIGSGNVLAISILTGEVEAWDSSLYWTLGYPTFLLFSISLGYLSPVKSWRWPVIIMLMQPVAIAIYRASSGQGLGTANLLPIAMVVFFIMSLPCILAAYVGAQLAKLFNKTE